MQTLKEIIDACDRLGLVAAVVLVCIVAWRFLRPRMEKWFDKHFLLIDTLQQNCANQKEDHAKTHKGIAHLGQMMAKSEQERKPMAESLADLME